MGESWHIPRALSDEALRLLSQLPMEEIERRLRQPLRPIPMSAPPESNGLNDKGECWEWDSTSDAWVLIRPVGRPFRTGPWLHYDALPLPEEKQ